MDHIGVTVNGRRRALQGVTAHTTALEWLRGIGLTGCKEGCAEGECGACAVLLATPDDGGGTEWTAVNACLVPVAALDGQELVTAEGLGTPEAPHPVQAGLAEAGGSQCGYCTPGFACSMAGEFYRHDRTAGEPDAADAADTVDGRADAHHGPNGFDLHALSGNLCRCTGYRPIRDAAFALGAPEAGDPLAERRARPAPDARRDQARRHGDERFVRPASLDEALRHHARRARRRGRRGHHRLGRRREPPRHAARRSRSRSSGSPSCARFDVRRRRASRSAPRSRSPRSSTASTARVPLLAELFPRFASPLIRNRATIGGNLGTASPIGDTAPALLALEARVVLVSVDGEREVDLAEYFTGYRADACAGPTSSSGRCGFRSRSRASPPSTRSRSADSTTSRASPSASRSISTTGVVASRAHRTRRRRGHPDPRAGDRGRARRRDRGIVETARDAASVLGTEGTPMSDHRASAEYRSLMLGTALLKLHRSTPLATEGVPA